MQIWQLFIAPRHPVTILVTACTIKCDNKIKQVLFISTLRETSVNRKDFRALTLVGPPRDNLESNPLAVLLLDNRLCM